MARLLALALVLCAGTCYASNRIVGGVTTRIEDFPSTVQIEFQGVTSGTWAQNCGGNILNNIFILSAARCFSGALYEHSLRRIRAGSADRNSGGVLVNILNAINHPSYGQASTFDSDISVVRLTSFLFYTPSIQAIGIPPAGANIFEGTTVTLVGWGSTENGGLPASTLQYTNALVVNRDTCRDNYATLPISSVVTDNMLCTGFLASGGRDSCLGDAGGPIIFADAVIGVISWGHGCGEAEFPGVSTLVPSFTNWILDTVNANTA